MRLGRVLGSVTQTIHHPAYDGLKLMVVQPLDELMKDTGQSYLAVDLVQAGPGDVVLSMHEGNGIRSIFKNPQLPIQAVLIGIVDHVQV